MRNSGKILDRPAYTPTTGDERRLTRRLRRTVPVLVTDPASGLVVRAETDNVSLFGWGLRFEDPVPFARDQTVHLVFEDTASRAVGRVAWSYILGERLNVGLERIPSLSGDLATNPLPWILLDVERNRSTGIMRFESGDVRILLYIEDGSLSHATSNRPVVGLARILFRLKRIAKSDVVAVEEAVAEKGISEQRILLERKLIDSSDVLPLLRLQAEQLIARLFSWNGGTFSFEPMSFSEVRIPRLGLNPGRIVSMGMRRVSPTLLASSIPRDAEPLSPGLDPFELGGRSHFGERAQRLLEFVNGHRTVGEIVKLASMDRETARQALGVLVGSVLVEVGEEIPRKDGGESRKSPAEGFAAVKADVEDFEKNLNNMTYYQIMRVDMSASGADIKRSYHGLARRFHPDQHRSIPREYRDRLHTVFTRVQEAYSVLSDGKRRKDYDQRIGQYSRGTGTPSATTRPSAPTAENIFYQGQEAFKSGDFEAAAESFKWAAKIAPTKSTYHFAAGEALAKLPRRGKDAEEYLKKAVELSPYNIDFLMGLARLYLASDLPSRAEGTLRKVLELDPEHQGALRLLRTRF